MSAVRSVAVSEEANSIAFVSHDDGRVALLTRRGDEGMLCNSLEVGPEVELNPIATSVAFFSIASGDYSTNESYVAVGFASGNVALFETDTARPLVVTRPAADLQVRRLRFYPAFHLLPDADPYPFASNNCGLFAVLAWSGTMARLSLTEVCDYISQARTSGRAIIDDRGAGWVIWKTTAQDAVLDAAICGSDLSSICELDVAPPEAPLRLVLGGVNPAVAAYTVTADPAFSARDAAKRAASSVLSAARGFLLSRITSGTDLGSASPNDERKAVNGVARFSTSWADNGAYGQPLINFGDVRETARKSVQAVLKRGQISVNVDGAASTESYRRNSRRSVHGDQVSQAFETQSGANTVIASGPDAFSPTALTRQRSRFSGSEVAQSVKLPQNTRIVERMAVAPLPCSLIATSDTLGRIFIQDTRDLCVLRILKGYREAQIAWVSQGVPFLAVYAPRLNVLEVHAPLDVKRTTAFRLTPGSMLVQSCNYRVFCVSADGRLHELMRARKGQSRGSDEHPIQPLKERQIVRGDEPGTKEETGEDALSAVQEDEFSGNSVESSPPDYELVGTFVDAVKKGQTSTAVDCLQRVDNSALKVAHLMATLVTCTQFARTEVHVALASKAAQISANLGNKELKTRFEAHGRLAEAFALLAAETMPEDPDLEQRRVSTYGHRLLEDELGSGLVEFAVDELANGPSPRTGIKRMKTVASEHEIINCERFVLSHSLIPCSDLRVRVDYVLSPRHDLSESERVWLSKAYFSRLLEVDSAGLPVTGREHPTTRDVFMALTDLLGLSEAEIASHFVIFILNMPLLTLLNTHASTHASPIRCAVGRLRGRFSSEVVNPILKELCENTTRIPSAVLLLRLYTTLELGRSSSEGDAPFLESLNRLDEVLLFRKLIAGSSAPRSEYEGLTAASSTGVPGDAERQAVACLIGWNDFDRATKILMGLAVSRKRQSLEWHESAAVSEAALHACRKKSVLLMTDHSSRVIPAGVVAWVRAADVAVPQAEWEKLLSEQRELALRELRAVLLAAHQYFPDSSVDAVRCLQLAEAMSALLELEVNKEEGEQVGASAQGSTDYGTSCTVQQFSNDDDGVDNFRAVPTVPHESHDSSDMVNMMAVPIVSQEPSEMDVDEANDLELAADERKDDEGFYDASSGFVDDVGDVAKGRQEERDI